MYYRKCFKNKYQTNKSKKERIGIPICGIIINVNQDGDFQDYKFCPYCGERLGV